MDIQLKEWVLLLLGALIGLAISHFYYRRSFKKSLSTYQMFHASPMTGMASEVKGQLEVKFKGQSVANLIEAQFLVINDGVKALRDLIEPLTLTWSAGLRMLDAQVVRSSTGVNSIQLAAHGMTDANGRLEIPIKLMNAGDWFILKVVADGPGGGGDWRWSISVDELPPSLLMKKMTTEDLGRFPLSRARRQRAAAITALGLALSWACWWSTGWLGDWSKAHAPEGSFWQGVLATLAFAVGLSILVGLFVALAAAAKVVQGWRPFGKELPCLPEEILSDVWRGHSAQPDVVDRLRKAVENL